uniref:Uncharacterized protein n=1 Tax=Arundo donax TaxID=35708 RepID=A0A0A9GDA6_ARUDO
MGEMATGHDFTSASGVRSGSGHSLLNPHRYSPCSLTP